MSDEKQAKESKKVSEKIVIVKRADTLKNEVVIDNIRKETNVLESVSQRSWLRKYPHLTGRFFHKILVEDCKNVGLSLDTFERSSPEDALEHSPIPLKPSPPTPKTMSALIGHRSSRAEHNLEFMGRLYISPRWTIEPPADTPESRTAQQKLIFLA